MQLTITEHDKREIIYSNISSLKIFYDRATQCTTLYFYQTHGTERLIFVQTRKYVITEGSTK